MPLVAQNHRVLARMLWRLGRREEAAERLQRALRLDVGNEGTWTTFRKWAKELGRPEMPLELARDLIAKRGNEARTWVALAWCLEDSQRLDEQLAALEKAITLQPRLFEAHDLRAEVLARQNRFDDALAACRPAAFGDHPPLGLRGCEAWIEAARGNTLRAITLMQAVLAEHPDYVWGWRRLTDWLWRDKRHEEALEAADQVAALEPFDATHLGHRANLKLERGIR